VTVNQIDGGRQIRSATITTTQLSASAGIVDGQLATSYIKADGTRAFTGEVAGVTPTSTASLATKGYVDGIAQGLDQKPSARVQTATETLTIASGSVTTIGGTTVDGVTAAVNDYILIANAPAATGAAGGIGVYTTQPGNGLYKVSAVAANISVARAPEQSGSINPAGDYVFVETGSTGNSGYRVTSPSSGAAFTYGTTNMVWTQFSGAGEVLVGSGLTKSGNTLDRAALTGDVAATAGSNATTIGTNVVTYAKFQQVAANSVVGNLTGSTANAGAVSATAAATASTVMTRDTNANTRANSVAVGVTTTATSAGTLTLTVASTQVQQFTGATTHTLVLPDATTLPLGTEYDVPNRSTGAITVNANGGGNTGTVSSGARAVIRLIAAGSAAGTWDFALAIATASGTGDASTNTSTSVDSEIALFSGTGGKTLKRATGSGLAKLTSGVLSTGTAGTDYLAPSSVVTRETPSGTVNGSNTAFTLANTPIAGTEQVFLNGLLQEPGAGNDYTISTNTITYLTAPIAGDKIRVTYLK
jgi:hypothetical protein